MLHRTPKIGLYGGVEPAAPLSGNVAFEGVRFTYPTRPDVPVLKGLSFTVAPGSVTALIGPSGSGKSTVMALLERFYSPGGGRILLDGHDLRDLRLDDLRREVMLVDQSPWLFNDSIAANIGFALPDVRVEDIEAAAHAAGLDAFLARLPEGLDTRTGERGLALSAGERQRIVIARALLRRPSAASENSFFFPLNELQIEPAPAWTCKEGNTELFSKRVDQNRHRF